MEERILDNLVEEKNVVLSPTKKVFRVIEGILRIFFFSLITFFIVVIAADRIDWGNTEVAFLIGFISALLIFEFFYINHLIQGIRCILIKEYRTYLLFPIVSLIGLLFFVIVLIVAVLDTVFPNPVIYQIIPWFVIGLLLVYLTVKEINLIKRRVR